MGGQGSTESPVQRSHVPGKRTLTETLSPVQARSGPPSMASSSPAPAVGSPPVTSAARPTLESLFGGQGVAQPSAGPGAPLPSSLRQKMEAAFATDFSAVRVHEGGGAPAMAAVAYTCGNDLHFAPGRFDPASQAGQELIGHELTHVVQQRAGRVATPRGQGAPINADPALEAEADALGAQAARGEPAAVAGGGGGAVPGAIQRKIGFEFQLQNSLCWQVTDPEHYQEAMQAPKESGNPYRERIPKPRTLLQSKGFELQADDGAVSGTSELEIVTEAFEEDKAGAKAMKQAMSSIMALGDRLQHLQPAFSHRGLCAPAGELGGIGKVMDPHGHLLALGDNTYVSPQATGAIRLDQIFKVMEDFASHDSVPGESGETAQLRQGKSGLGGRGLTNDGHSRLGEGVACAAYGLAQYKAQHHLDDWVPSNEIKSLLGLVVSYLLMGSQPIDAYPKTIAPLLSRTPLHLLFGRLPPVEQGMFRSGDFLQLVGLALPGMDFTLPVFQFGVYTGERYGEKRSKAHVASGRDITRMLDRLTRDLWILSIPIKDALTQDAFQRGFDDDEGVEAAAELESLGSWQELGAVGAKKKRDRIPAGIFELRTLSKIPFTWIPLLADAFYQYVVAVNQQKEAYLQIDEKKLQKLG